MRHVSWLRTCALITVISFPSPSLATEPDARSTVDSFHQALKDVMREGPSLGFRGRRDRLRPIIERTFDLGFISSVVSGQYWDSMSGTEQAEMTDTFSALTVATYASRFDEYSGEKFTVVDEKPLKRDRMLVRSELRTSDGDVVQLDYVLHMTTGAWKVINVIADGVSDLSIKRADYSAVLKGAGFAALISRLNEQTASLASGT